MAGGTDFPFFGSVDSDPVLQQEALALWEKNRTGPYTALVRIDHLGWVRVPDDAPIFKTSQDPSSGPTAAHIEFLIGVSTASNSSLEIFE